MLAGKPVDVDVERHGTDAGAEVEEPVGPDVEPAGQVVRIGQRRGEADDADLVGGVRRDVVGARHNHLEHGAAVGAQQVNLVNDNQRHRLDVAAVLPAATDAVPLFRRGDNDVRPLNGALVWRRITRQFHHVLAQVALQPHRPAKNKKQKRS